MKEMHKETIEEVREKLLNQMEYKPDIFSSFVMSIPLTDVKERYGINVFSTKYSKRIFGFMVGNITRDEAIDLF